MPSYITRKTKNGTFVDVRFRIIDESGKEINKRLCGFQNKRAAQQGYVEFMKSYSPPVIEPPKGKEYSFDYLFSLYKKKCAAELAPSSQYDLAWIFERFITPRFSCADVLELKKEDFVTWQTELWSATNPKTGKPYSQKYLTKIRSDLSTFLSWCEETYDIPNLMKAVHKPRRKESKKEMQIWELSEFLMFQNAVDDIVWKTFFMTLFYSGCRVGEILALSDKDVQLVENNYVLTINKGLSRKTNSEQEKYIISSPKTASSNRTVALPDLMTEQFNQYLIFKKEQGISSAFLFGGVSPIPQRTYQRRFDEYARKAGVKKIRIHDLRHSHASLLIHLNVPITVISKRLGHSSVQMTLEKYAHCYSEGENVAISSLNHAIDDLKDK